MFSASRRYVCLALLVLTGCSTGSGRVAVRGRVTLDGEPVDKGHIRFMPEFDNGVPAAIQVLGGSYAFDERDGPKPGKYRVILNCEKPTGNKIPDLKSPKKHLIDELKEAIPAKYNSSSTLLVVIQRSSHELDFDLKSTD